MFSLFAKKERKGSNEDHKKYDEDTERFLFYTQILWAL